MAFRKQQHKNIPPILFGFLGVVGVLVSGFLIYLLPPVNNLLAWRVEYAGIYLRGMINPVQPLPTSAVINNPTIVPETSTPILPTPTLPVLTETPVPTITPSPTMTAIPNQVRLDPPAYEKEDQNNCGPATLSMYLNYYGWQGNQHDISSVIKPTKEDRNVNVEELIYYVSNKVGYLKVQFRVGGSIERIKQIVATGLPVMIEEGYLVNKKYWPNDDMWSGHYLLINGYDDESQSFITQDVFAGPNVDVKYADLDKRWQSFNRVYILVYPAEKEAELKNVLGEDWDPNVNRQNALESSRAETISNPGNVYAWFNLGSNLVYFERYEEAAAAFDTARKIGFPQRMLRYQFSPFIAYFHSLRTEDLQTLTAYALGRTPNSEEALLWEGWAQYRLGNNTKAIESFQKALDARPGYADAEYALEFVKAN